MPCFGVAVAVVCSSCGEIWARIYEGEAQSWRGFTWPCANCPPWPLSDSIPGSLLGILGGPALPYLPQEALRRELEVHLMYYEKGLQNERSTEAG